MYNFMKIPRTKRPLSLQNNITVLLFKTSHKSFIIGSQIEIKNSISLSDCSYVGVPEKFSKPSNWIQSTDHYKEGCFR